VLSDLLCGPEWIRRRSRKPLATILGEKGGQFVHRLEIRLVDPRTPLLPAEDQPRAPEFLQVKGEGRGGQPQTRGESTWSLALGTALDQEAEYFKASLLREGAQGPDGIIDFHTSKYIEINAPCNPCCSRRRA